MTSMDSQNLKDRVAGMFDRSAPSYDQVGPHFFSHFGRRLVEIAQPAEGATVLDVATGRGAVLFPAAEQVGPGGQVVGIDLAEGMVSQTAEAIRGGPWGNVEVRAMDAEQLDFPDASFDMVFCGFALFFFPHLTPTLAEFRRVLKPGGRLAVTTWGRDDERWAWLGELTRKYTPPQFQRPPAVGPAFNRPDGMRTMLSDAGFTDIQVSEEDVEFTYADEEEWLAVQWSHGMRFMLEMASPTIREQMIAEAFDHLRALKHADGIPHRLWTLYALGVK